MNLNNLMVILLSDKPSEKIKQYEEGIFKVLPELELCKGFEQHNSWHPYDVYEHTLRVVDGVPPVLSLRLAALFHDIGKPIKFTTDSDGVGHFPFHWVESLRIFDKFIDNYEIDDKLLSDIRKLIYFHDLNIDRFDRNELVDFFSAFDNESLVHDLFKLKRADINAQSYEKAVENDLFNTLDRQENEIIGRINSVER